VIRRNEKNIEQGDSIDLEGRSVIRGVRGHWEVWRTGERGLQIMFRST